MAAIWVIDQRLLRWYGKERGWTTHDQIARGLGVAPSTLSRMVNGKSKPGHELLAAIRWEFGQEGFDDITSVVTEEVSA